MGGKDRDFWNYIEEFQFVGLVETWVEEKNWEKIRNKLPGGYVWKYQPAVRENKKGRAKGGIITGVVKDWEVREEERQRNGIMQRKAKIGGKIWSIWTVYSGEGIEKLEQSINDLISEEEENVMIVGGDSNARIGKKGTLYLGEEEEEEEGKSSRDIVTNTEGERMLRITEDRG